MTMRMCLTQKSSLSLSLSLNNEQASHLEMSQILTEFACPVSSLSSMSTYHLS